MIPLYLESTDTALITQIQTDLSGTLVFPIKGSPIRNPVTYASTPALVLNSPLSDIDNLFEIDDVGINPAYDAIQEPKPDRDGLVTGQPREIQKIIRLRGWVKAASLAKLNDKIAVLNEAFNPVNTYANDASSVYDRGFVPLKFYQPTNDTANWPNGYIPMQYYVRPVDMPVSVSTKFDDYQARFSVPLLAADPRKYHQTLSSNDDDGASFIPANNLLASYNSYPILEMVFSVIPTADIGITLTGNLNVIYLDKTQLTDAAGKTLIIDTQARTVQYSNGTDKSVALKSTSRFFSIAARSNVSVQFAGADISSRNWIKWRRAFV